MEENIALITAYAEQYGIFFIVPLVLIENIPIIGLIAPGITVLILAGFFSTVLPGGPLVIMAMIYITMVAADTFWYFMGRKFGTKFRWLRYIKEKSPTIEGTVIAQPITILMWYQFVPYLRMFLPFTLGLYHYPLDKWLKTTLCGSFLFTLTYVGIGWGASLWFATIEDSSSFLAFIPLIAVVVTLGFSIHLAVKYFEQRKLGGISQTKEDTL